MWLTSWKKKGFLKKIKQECIDADPTVFLDIASTFKYATSYAVIEGITKLFLISVHIIRVSSLAFQ
jgi:hypothetical protein